MAIEFKKSEQETTPKTYKYGDTFLNQDNEPCFIAWVGKNNEVQMVCLDGVSYGTKPTQVNDKLNISEQEIRTISNGQILTPCDFILTEKK